jgi:hypothetical protein
MTMMVDSTSALGLQTRLDVVARGSSSDDVPVTCLFLGTSITEGNGRAWTKQHERSDLHAGALDQRQVITIVRTYSPRGRSEERKTQSSDPVPERNTAKIPKHCSYYRALPGCYNARSGVTRIRQRPPRQENDEKRAQKTAHPNRRTGCPS